MNHFNWHAIDSCILFTEVLKDKTIVLFGYICGNANVNETKLQTLQVGDRFELIPFTSVLRWKEPNSTRPNTITCAAQR